MSDHSQRLSESTLAAAGVAADPAGDPLLRWTEQLTAGERIDWDAAAAELDPALLAGLKQLASMMGGFAEAVVQPAPTMPATLSTGSTFGPLHIIELIGRGAFGAVYRAHDPQLDRTVALKVLSQPALGRAALLREGQLMARIDHPNVLKVHGAVEHDGQIGFACELMPGETLEHWLHEQGTVGAHELVAIGLQLCAALCALHQGDIVHADLKPGNVLRHADGRWVVADFGSSQLARSDHSSTGTPLYMAPERFTHPTPTAATDQYSLGVLLFRLATRRYPFVTAAVAVTASAGPPTRLQLLDLRPDLPTALVTAIERSLSCDPQARFPSLGAVAVALTAALSAPAPAPVQINQRRRRLGIALAALAVALLGGALLWQRADAPITTAAPGGDPVWLRATTSGDEVLHPGGAVRLGDALALELNLDRSRHVYVINEDSHGERFQLFPLTGSDLANPLPAGRIRLPGSSAGEALDWRITSRGGRERFYVLIADTPIADLQQLALDEATRELGADERLLAGTSEPWRGAGGLTPHPATATAVDAGWLKQLRQRHPALEVQQFELSNP